MTDINIRISMETYKRLEKQKSKRKGRNSYKKHIDDLSKLPVKLIENETTTQGVQRSI